MSDQRVSIKRDPTKEEVKLILRTGKAYKHVLLPADIQAGPMGWCFDWSMIQCMETKEKYRYVEGLARDRGDKKWFLHAWLTDGVHAFDATWAALDKKGRPVVSPTIRYVGIEIPLLQVLAFVKATEYQGLIPNRHRLPEFVKGIVGF